MAERAIIENSTREYRRQRRMADDRVIQCWGGGLLLGSLCACRAHVAKAMCCTAELLGNDLTATARAGRLRCS